MDLRQGGNPLLWPALCFAAAIGVGVEAPRQVALGALGALALCGIAALVMMRLRSGVMLVAAMAGVVAGMSAAAPELPQEWCAGRWLFSGRVVRVVQVTSHSAGTSMDVVIDSVGEGSGALRPVRELRTAVTLLSGDVDPTVTGRLAWRGKLMPLDDFTAGAFPFAESGSRWMRRRGVSARAVVHSNEIAAYGERPGLLCSLQRLNGRLACAISDTPLSSSTQALLEAVLLGNSAMLEPGRRLEWSAAGLSHLLALSGLHVALVASLVALLLLPLRLAGLSRRVEAVVIVVILWLYAAVTGLSPSVVRSVVMATLLAGAFLLQRRPTPLNSLAVAAFLILSFDPRALFSPGFQLSFAAVGCIILFAYPLNPFRASRRGWLRKSGAAVAASLCAYAGTAPLVVLHFHSLPLLFLLPSLAGVVLLPPLVCGGALVTALSAMGLHVPPLTSAVDGLAHTLDSMAAHVAALPGAVATGLEIHPVAVIAILFALCVMAAALHWRGEGRRRLPALVAAQAALCALLITFLTTAEADAHDRLLLMPDHGRASLLIRRGAHAWLWSSRPADSLAVKHRALTHYGAYLRSAGVDPSRLWMLPDSLADGPVAYSGSLMRFHGVTLTMDGATPAHWRVIPPDFHRPDTLTLRHAGAVALSPGLRCSLREAVRRAHPRVTEELHLQGR